MLQCIETLRLVSREFEMSDEFWVTALLPYHEFVFGDGLSSSFLYIYLNKVSTYATIRFILI